MIWHSQALQKYRRFNVLCTDTMLKSANKLKKHPKMLIIRLKGDTAKFSSTIQSEGFLIIGIVIETKKNDNDLNDSQNKND